jgi:anti-sigma B factor antagonist
MVPTMTEDRSVTWSADGANAADGRLQILTVCGELDLATADRLYRQGHAAIERRVRCLLLDLTELSFCDARGLSAFVRLANEAETAGCGYGLVAPQALVAKLLRITGLRKRIQVFATSEEAHRLLTGSGS